MFQLGVGSESDCCSDCFVFYAHRVFHRYTFLVERAGFSWEKYFIVIKHFHNPHLLLSVSRPRKFFPQCSTLSARALRQMSIYFAWEARWSYHTASNISSNNCECMHFSYFFYGLGWDGSLEISNTIYLLAPECALRLPRVEEKSYKPTKAEEDSIH